jgi:mannose-6-phosphate isomerase-like protein (cupin superfamily)
MATRQGGTRASAKTRPAEAEFLEDPMFHQRYRFSTKGDVLITEIWVQPGGGVDVDHVHPHQEERVEVVEGEAFVYRIDGKERRMGPGDKAVVPAGVKHAFRNDGQDVAYLRFESEPPMDLQESVEVAVAMTQAESFTASGMPKDPSAMLAAAEFAERYKETTRLLTIPWAVQQVMNPGLAWLSRRRGVGWRAPS